jgi:hypothetical protein
MFSRAVTLRVLLLHIRLVLPIRRLLLHKGVIMGLLDFLFGSRSGRKSVAPYQVTSNIPPQENYAGYTTVPYVPWSQGDYVPDPYRMHAPFQVERGNKSLVTNAGVHWFDEGDPNLLRVPDQPGQQYFNQKKELPPLRIFAPAHGVFVPRKKRQSGWMQTFVPDAGRRAVVSGVAPVWLLSTPITNVSKTTSFDSKRAPIANARAPKPKKGGMVNAGSGR